MVFDIAEHLIFALVFCMRLIGTAESTVSCSFDSGPCGWRGVGSSSFQWRGHSGPSPDRTSGPLNDHTCNNTNGQYLLVSGQNAQSRNDTAVLESETIELGNTTVFQFWYLMNGLGVGNLSLAVTSDGVDNVVWSEAGRQGNGWQKASVELAPGNVTIRLSATVRLPYGSDLAIDDLRLASENYNANKSICSIPTTTTTTTTPTTTTITTTTTTTTPAPTTKSATKNPKPSTPMTLPWSCDFSSGLCGINVIPNRDPFVTWEITDKKDGSKWDGVIAGDQGGDGYYLHYIVKKGFSWSGRPVISFETSVIASTSVNLTFWYNMPSKYSNLGVYTHPIGGNESRIWYGIKSPAGWHKETVSISENKPFKIVFKAKYIVSGLKVGLDGISIVEASASQRPGSPTPTHSATTRTHSATTPTYSGTRHAPTTQPLSISTSNVTASTTKSSTHLVTVSMNSSTVKLSTEAATTIPITPSSSPSNSTAYPPTTSSRPTKLTSYSSPSVVISASSTTPGTASTPGLVTTTLSHKPKPTGQRKPVADKDIQKQRKLTTIIGVSVGSVAGLVLVLVIIYYVHLNMRKQPGHKQSNIGSSHVDLAVTGSKGGKGGESMAFNPTIYENVTIDTMTLMNGKVANGHANGNLPNGHAYDNKAYDISTDL